MRCRFPLLMCASLSLSAWCQDAPDIENYQQLLGHVCHDTSLMTASSLQASAAETRVKSGRVDKWIPEVDTGLKIYHAEGEPTNFYSVQGGEDPLEPNGFQKGEAWEGRVDLTWALYKEGRWVGENDLEQINVESQYQIANAQLESTHQQSIKLVSQYYFEALVYSLQVDLLKPLVAERKLQLESIQEKMDEGISATSDFYTVQAAYLSMNEQLSQAERDLATNNMRIKILTNLDSSIAISNDNKNFKELTSIETMTLDVEDVAGKVQQLPEIRLMAAKMDFEKEKLVAARGQLKPNLNFYMKMRTSDNLDYNNSKDYEETGFEVEYPLGDIIANSSESKALKKSVAALNAEMDYVKKIKFLQASNMANDLSGAKNQIKAAESELNRRVQLLERDQEKFSSGLLGLNELMETEDAKIRAELALLVAYKEAWKGYIDAAVFFNIACQK